MAAVPAPTIVFGVLTCTCFGLAIVDTVAGDRHTSRLDDYAQVREARREAEAAMRRARDERDRRREQQERLHAEKLKALYGSEVASFGRAFAGIELGAPIVKRLDATAIGFETSLVKNELWIEVGKQDTGTEGYCRKLEAHLREAWGPGRQLEFRAIWLDDERGRRANLSNGNACTLAFEQVAPLASWLDRTQGSIVPVWAVGQPVLALKLAIGVPALELDDRLAWMALGVGAGIGGTQLTAYVARDRVIGVYAKIQVDSSTRDAIAARIRSLTKMQPRPNTMIWDSHPRFELRDDGVLVGTVPAQ